MLETVRRCFCFTTAIYLIMYFANKGITVTMESDSLKSEKKDVRNARSKDISSVAEILYPAINDKEFGSMTLKLHKDKYRLRRLLSSEDEPAKQANNSSMTRDDSVAKNYQIPDDIQEMCPFADICQLRSIEEIKRPYISCCRSCYCDKYCGRRGDCCFTEDDGYRSETENTTGCIKTAIQGWGGPILSVIKEYHVIDSCLSSGQTCKEKTSAPWGTLFPGYSPKTGLIYFNRHCAACNNVDDFQLWNFYIMSDVSDDISNELLLEALEGNSYPIAFIPPNTDDVKKHECFKSAIKACNVTGEWQEYDPAIEEACHRFQAPAYHRRASIMFNNIYCLICNGKADDYTERCLTLPLYSRGGSGTALSGLLDFATISQTLSTEPVSSATDCPRHTVRHPYKDECRPILCPFGYTMTSLDCQLYIREWNKYGYIQMIELLPEQEGLLIPVTAFNTLTEKERNNPKLWINTQGLPMGTFKLFGLVRQNTSSVSKMVVRIYGSQVPLKIDKILSKVESALSKVWKMKLNGYTYRLKAKLYRYRSYLEDQDYQNMDVGKLRENHPFDDGYVFISKMNFCKQVQLYDNEYVFRIGRVSLQLNLTGDGKGKTLGDGEFLQVFHDTVAPRLKICIEDFVNEPQSARFKHVQGSLFTTVSLAVIVFIRWYLLR